MNYKEKWGFKMNKIDKEKLHSIIRWATKNPNAYVVDIDEYLFNPLMEAFGDDVDEILAYLNEMDVNDLDEISGCFEDIYGKFMTDEVWDALEKLEKKIDEENTRMKEYREREKSGN